MIISLHARGDFKPFSNKRASLPQHSCVKWINTSLLKASDEFFRQMLSWFQRVFTRGVALPLDEVLWSASLNSFCHNTIDFVNVPNSRFYLQSVFGIKAMMADIIQKCCIKAWLMKLKFHLTIS